MCEGCRRRFAKATLVRFTVTEEGGRKLVVIDRSAAVGRGAVGRGASAGRGAYVCRNTECFNRAAGKKAKGLSRRLGAAGVHPDLESEFKRLMEVSA